MNQIVPILPCKQLDELLLFYRQLGFVVTYQQKSPNPYAVVEKDWMRLDFYGIKHHDPKKCYHTCYIVAEETDALYEQFTSAMKKANGKLPTRGLPRISEIRNKLSGVREFMFSDVAGNCIRIGRKLPEEEEAGYTPEVAAASKRLALTLNYAYHYEDMEDEYEKIPPMLDKAIEKERAFPCLNLYKVMVLRATMAIHNNEPALAGQLLHEVKTSRLIASHPAKYKAELQRVADLEAQLNTGK